MNADGVGNTSLKMWSCFVNDDTVRLGDAAAFSAAEWLGYRVTRPDNWEDTAGNIPVAPPQHTGYGITVDELANAQRRFTNYARLRLTGVGKRDYDHGGRQAFEDMGLHRLINELRDEIADAVNYLTFLDIQLSRWKTALEEKT